MKSFRIAVLTSLTATALGQAVSLRPVVQPENPVNAVQFLEKGKPIQHVYASGHWRYLDKVEEADAVGFSVSQISCSQTTGCLERSVTILPFFGFKVVMEDPTEYDIVSWRSDGLTARYVTDDAGCRNYTLDVDFKTGSIMRTDAPTRVNPPELGCLLTKSSSEQLMEGTSFQIVAGKVSQ